LRAGIGSAIQEATFREPPGLEGTSDIKTILGNKSKHVESCSPEGEAISTRASTNKLAGSQLELSMSSLNPRQAKAIASDMMSSKYLKCHGFTSHHVQAAIAKSAPTNKHIVSIVGKPEHLLVVGHGHDQQTESDNHQQEADKW
jgi:hypothetical protein